MIKKLVVPLFVVGLAFAGCGDDDKPATDAAVAGSGGAGGSAADASTAGTGGGGSGGGGAGGATTADGGAADVSSTGDGAAGAAGDGSTAGDTSTSGDTSAASDASAVSWTMCPASGTLPNVSAADFCKQYMTACGFAAGNDRFASEADCITKYTMLPTANSAKGQACAAYHLCAASAGGAAMTTHCPHPVQATLAPPSGPCAP